MRSRACAFLAVCIPFWGSAQAPAVCRQPGWSAPAPLVLVDGRPVYVEAPSSVTVARGVALFGVPTIPWESPTVLLTSGEMNERYAGVLLGRASVTLIPLPAGVTYMLDPLAVSDGRGGAHVLW